MYKSDTSKLTAPLAKLQMLEQQQQPEQQATLQERLKRLAEQRALRRSSRFAMIDDGFGFSLVPWTPQLERHLGQTVTGTMKPGGGIDWSLGRKRGLGI